VNLLQYLPWIYYNIYREFTAQLPQIYREFTVQLPRIYCSITANLPQVYTWVFLCVYMRAFLHVYTQVYTQIFRLYIHKIKLKNIYIKKNLILFFLIFFFCFQFGNIYIYMFKILFISKSCSISESFLYSKLRRWMRKWSPRSLFI
jgi:hypothetical protein